MDCLLISLASIGQARDSDGCPVGAIMWRANRLVDILAKAAAAGFHSQPPADAVALLTPDKRWSWEWPRHAPVQDSLAYPIIDEQRLVYDTVQPPTHIKPHRIIITNGLLHGVRV